ncbi:MAG: hypothetical protein EGQ60_07005 [Clostridiales bacterium]|nr:hypothetical protein [Clostridiales bacterium]
MCEKKINVPALFGEMVFGEQQMQQRLPADVYRAWQQSLAQGTALDRSVAGEIAGAMKDWAIEKGATHYTHWFQPMTGFTAEKHDSFITRDGKDGVRMELSAKELKALETYPVGGFVLTGSNIQDKDQLDKLMGRLKKTSSVTPLFALQEEGGMGATIAGKETFGLAKTETPAALGSTGDGAKVKDAAATIGKALADLGFQMNLAPTCDVGSALSFSESPEQAAMCTSAAVEGFHEGGVACVLKHYPGQGGTNASEGASLTETWETMRTTSLYPFQAGMAAGADAIMVSHVTTPNASSDGLPASLSQEMITSKLRGELRFSRLIMTAPLSDPAIAQHYDSGDAALRAFQAGADILLQPEDLSAAYTAVLSAVKDGTISQQRLDESVLRVLQLKERYGLI